MGGSARANPDSRDRASRHGLCPILAVAATVSGHRAERAGGCTSAPFPGLASRGGGLACGERQVKAVGIDTASIDYVSPPNLRRMSRSSPRTCRCSKNLGDLRDLPDQGFDVIALPMKIAGGTGGPLRVIAVLPPSH